MLFEDNFNFPDLDIFPAKKVNNDLVSKEVGLIRGNSFESEYVPYKNYNPGIMQATSEKMAKLIEIMELCFRKVDLNLFLDLNPNNEELLNQFKTCVEKLAMKESEFVKSYGPLELMDAIDANSFTWISDPWPWEKGGNRDV